MPNALTYNLSMLMSDCHVSERFLYEKEPEDDTWGEHFWKEVADKLKLDIGLLVSRRELQELHKMVREAAKRSIYLRLPSTRVLIAKAKKRAKERQAANKAKGLAWYGKDKDAGGLRKQKLKQKQKTKLGTIREHDQIKVCMSCGMFGHVRTSSKQCHMHKDPATRAAAIAKTAAEEAAGTSVPMDDLADPESMENLEADAAEEAELYAERELMKDLLGEDDTAEL